MKTTLLTLLIALELCGQTKINLRTQAKDVDFSGAAATKTIKTGTELPATCQPGELFLNTTALAGANIYACLTANTWTVEASGGTFSSQAQAETGTSATTYMNPLRVAQAISAQTPVPPQAGHGNEMLSTNGATAVWMRPWDPASSGRRILSWIAGGAATLVVPGTDWALTGSGSAANLDPTASTSEMVRITSGASSGNAHGLSTAARPFRSGHNLRFSARLALGSVTDIKLWAGVAEDTLPFDTSNNATAQAILFRYVAGTDTNFGCLTRNASTSVVRDSGVPADTNAHDFVWAVNDDIGAVQWWIDNTEVCTASPTSSLPVNVGMRPGLGVTTTTASNKTLDLSWLVYEADR